MLALRRGKNHLPFTTYHLPGEKSRGARTRTNNKLNPHITPSLGIKLGPHWWEASALTIASSLLHTKEISNRQCQVKLIQNTEFIGRINPFHFCYLVTQVDGAAYGRHKEAIRSRLQTTSKLTSSSSKSLMTGIILTVALNKGCHGLLMPGLQLQGMRTLTGGER